MKRSYLTIAVALLCAARLNAAPRAAGIFGDHMVLQSGVSLPVWGEATPNAEVEVKLGTAREVVRADTAGLWRVTLPAQNAMSPLVMQITSGGETTTFNDVLLGEVWLGAGQSNMAFTVSRVKDASAEIAAANYPKIRVFTVKTNTVAMPADDVQGEWKVASSATVGSFSAAAYFFARDVQMKLDRPVGVIVSAVGAAGAESFIRRETLLADARLKALVNVADERAKLYPEAKSKFDTDHAAWEAKMRSDGKGDVLATERTTAEAKALNEPRPTAVLNDFQYAAFIANGMITPIADYPVRGVLWYQGEHNAKRAEQYRDLLMLTVREFRDQWKQPNLPFFVVQLPNFSKRLDKPGNSTWAELRESQARVAAFVPNMFLAVTIDVGDVDVHPTNKQPVGDRLARLALKHVYGQEIVADSLTFASATVEGDQIRLKLSGRATAKDGAPRGFTIAGDDQTFVSATATQEADGTILVRSAAMAKPAAVRYAWADNPDCNLYGPGDLPVTPFRTDDWKLTTLGVEK